MAGEDIAGKPLTTLHGVLVSVEDLGVLMLGPSGCGKSSCALELLARGHLLAADDVVEIRRTADRLLGSPPERFFGLLEVAGLGICDVRKLFDAARIVRSGQIDLCIEFAKWSAGLPDSLQPIGAFECEGVVIPRITFISDGSRNAATFVETAVRFIRFKAGVSMELTQGHDLIVRSAGTGV